MKHLSPLLLTSLSYRPTVYQRARVSSSSGLGLTSSPLCTPPLTPHADGWLHADMQRHDPTPALPIDRRRNVSSSWWRWVWMGSTTRTARPKSRLSVSTGDALRPRAAINFQRMSPPPSALFLPQQVRVSTSSAHQGRCLSPMPWPRGRYLRRRPARLMATRDLMLVGGAPPKRLHACPRGVLESCALLRLLACDSVSTVTSRKASWYAPTISCLFRCA